MLVFQFLKIGEPVALGFNMLPSTVSVCIRVCRSLQYTHQQEREMVLSCLFCSCRKKRCPEMDTVRT